MLAVCDVPAPGLRFRFALLPRSPVSWCATGLLDCAPLALLLLGGDSFAPLPRAAVRFCVLAAEPLYSSVVQAIRPKDLDEMVRLHSIPPTRVFLRCVPSPHCPACPLEPSIPARRWLLRTSFNHQLAGRFRLSSLPALCSRRLGACRARSRTTRSRATAATNTSRSAFV